jgi:hypothetical protein
MAGTTFQYLSKPPTSGDEKELFRWRYRVVELLNEHLATPISHADLTNVLGNGEYHLSADEVASLAGLDGAGPYLPSAGGAVGNGTDQSYFETDGTLRFDGEATVWRDIDFPIIAKTTGAGLPNYATLQGNLTMLQWAVNDAEQAWAQEMVHQWKEGSQVTWHLHIITGGTNVDDRYTQWSVEYTWANYGGTLPANVTVNSGDLLIPAGTPALTHLIYTISTWTPTGGQIAAHVKARLKRIASAGTAPTANPFCEMLQLHIEQDTIGSRQITTK